VYKASSVDSVHSLRNPLDENMMMIMTTTMISLW